MKLIAQILLFVSLLILTLLPSSILGTIYKPSHTKNYNKIKPVFSPPNVVFSVVWPLLYILMSTSMWLILRNVDHNTYLYGNLVPLICVFIAQLALNFSWIPVFSNGKYMESLWILLSILLLAIISMVIMAKLNTLSSILWVPYVVWLFFAMQLNISVVVNHKSQIYSCVHASQHV